MSRMKKLKKNGKRFLALLLVFAIVFMSEAQALAAAGDGKKNNNQTGMILKDALEEAEKEREAEWRKASPLYNKLMETRGKSPISEGLNPKFPMYEDPFTERGEDWAAAYKQELAESGIELKLENEKKAAANKLKHTWRGNSSKYQGRKSAYQGLSQAADAFGSILGVANACSKMQEMLELQGDTVEEQMLELVILTAQFGIAAFSVIGMSLSFPLGLILNLLLELILDGIQAGVFDGDLPWERIPYGQKSQRGENYWNQRYKLPDGVNVYKPNIYIYSREKREITVSFAEAQLLTKTIPEYKDGWKATVDEENRLVTADGRNYDYLFYESITEPAIFQTGSGWKVSADMRKKQFEEILSGLNFNERETADFTEFWSQKLDEDTDYIMYPQSTELVDFAMPMEIREKPEMTERIWFVFAEDDGRKAEEPVGYELSRGGRDCPYYVIEWGGLILSE